MLQTVFKGEREIYQKFLESGIWHWVDIREECETSGFHTDEQSIAKYQKGPNNPRGIAIQKLGFGHCGSARD
eukprot:8196508-Karenia_brevis.AAC.1